MIEKMEKIFLYGLSADSGRMLSDLMECGCLEVVEPEKLAGQEEILETLARQAPDTYEAEQLLSRLSASISALAPYGPKPKLLARRPEIGYARLTDDAGMEEVKGICGRVEEIQRGINQTRSEMGKTEFLIASLEPWKELDIPLEEKGTRDSDIFLMLFPAGTTLEQLEKSVEEAGIPGVIQEISRDGDQMYAAAVCHRSQSGDFMEAMRQCGGTRAEFEKLSGTASENIAAARKELESLETRLARAEEELKEEAGNLPALKEAYDRTQLAIERGRARGKMLHTEATSLLTAWVPEKKKPQVEQVLAKYPCCYQFQKPSPEEEPPVLLKNSKLVEPFEAVTEMYALPMYNSIDADPFIAPFFFIFFGMMLSDAGYGLLLVIAGFLGAKLLDLGPGGKKMSRLIGLGGISTVIFGAMYGSWFGDAIPKIAETYLGMTVQVPLLIDPLTDPITILGASFVLGYIHIFVGLYLKAVLMIRRGHALDAFFDVGLWALLLLGLPMLAASAAEGILGASLAAGITTAGKWISIVAAAGLVLTQGRDRKNIFMKLVGGVGSLYDITGYFSDLLSYSRILALGLATGVIATVVNQIGTLLGGGIISAILFLAVFLFGHSMNLAINALGSYVHSARLQYVEFFGKFYEGGGKPFRPLAPQTKYVTITKQED